MGGATAQSTKKLTHQLPYPTTTNPTIAKSHDLMTTSGDGYRHRHGHEGKTSESSLLDFRKYKKPVANPPKIP